MAINPIVSAADAKPGTWVYKVDERSSTLCFVAIWEGALEPIFIEVEEKEARLSQGPGLIYTVPQVDIVPNYASARSGVTLRSGMICSTQTKTLLIYTSQNGQLSEADMMSGVSPMNASHAIGFSRWDVVAYGFSGPTTLISVSL